MKVISICLITLTGILAFFVYRWGIIGVNPVLSKISIVILFSLIWFTANHVLKHETGNVKWIKLFLLVFIVFI